MNGTFNDRLEVRKNKAKHRSVAFLIATIFSVLFLVLLIASIVNQSFGYVLVEADTDPASLARNSVALEDLDAAGLVETLREGLTRKHFAALDAEAPLVSRPREELLGLIQREIIREEVQKTWLLSDSVLHKGEIFAFRDAEFPEGRIYFRSWLSIDLLKNPQSSSALDSGLRGAALGSLATILLTIALAFPLGVAAAIWLEEYARDNRINRFISLNIYNLAGVPSIIYGMLGLALFVRALEPLSSGAVFGVAGDGNASGRTILSASLTLALLVLPVIIINAQEAIRAVPQSLRQAGLALGATKWQTIWHHVLPASADRILTGTVLAMSRALGETAPLVVVGASTFLSQDPTGPFSRFTTLPIQIYQWTARPQGEFRSLAAAAILVLLILLLALNATAIIMRNRYRSRRRTGT
ncbi:MAG: phosphate ABC transporter permease PstA [Rectinemataceae bacterium]